VKRKRVVTVKIPPAVAAWFPIVTISKAPVATDPIAAVVPLYVVLTSLRFRNTSIKCVFQLLEYVCVAVVCIAPCTNFRSRRIVNLSLLFKLVLEVAVDATKMSVIVAIVPLFGCASHTSISRA